MKAAKSTKSTRPIKSTCIQTGRALVALLVFLSLTFAFPTLADGPGYTVEWWTVDGGGATSRIGGGYSLGGTAGQPDAGVLTGDGYTLGGGFWHSGAALAQYIYLPLVLRSL